MALLLPFYVLKVRKELKKKGTNSAKRIVLSKELNSYVLEIDKVFKKLKKNNYITNKDSTMLLERLLNMNKELYGDYKEFMEVDMTTKQLLKVKSWEAIDRATAKATAIGEAKGISKTAKAMKAAGEAVDKIMLYTGLSRRQIAAL